MKTQKIIILVICYTLAGCTKGFLDEKPNSSLVTPNTISDYQNLLDNSSIMNVTGALPQLSSDEYYVTNQTSFDALSTQTQKNAYLWNKDIYGGETGILDWNQLYKGILYANSVLDGMNKISVNAGNQTDWNNIKGEALFYRAYAYSDLARNFCTAYNSNTASSDLGLPLKTSSGIDITLQRSNLQDTYNQIMSDASAASTLLRDNISTSNPNRPSKAAAFALLARVNLYMGKYAEANDASIKCLGLYNKLIDYNTVSTSSTTPFTYTTSEVIFYSSQVLNYTSSTGYTTSFTSIGVDPQLLSLYGSNDLRLQIFYTKNSLGNYNVKRGYVGGGFYAFTGLAVDEIMLINAECYARLNDTKSAMDLLNQLIVKRFKTGTYQTLTASSATDALTQILIERRKELVWRALRWSDLKRLNRDGANVTLTRGLNGQTYTLSPNSSRYVFPIPDDEIALSGIQQNSR